MSLLQITLLIISAIPSWGQNENLNKITKALKKGDLNTIVNYAPEERYGTMEHLQPGTNLEEKDIVKSEFQRQIENFFSQNPIEGFKVLQSFSGNGIPPMLLGKITVKNGKTFYIQTMMAKFDGNWRFVAFNILESLPNQLKSFDR